MAVPLCLGDLVDEFCYVALAVLVGVGFFEEVEKEQSLGKVAFLLEPFGPGVTLPKTHKLRQVGEEGDYFLPDGFAQIELCAYYAVNFLAEFFRELKNAWALEL